MRRMGTLPLYIYFVYMYKRMFCHSYLYAQVSAYSNIYIPEYLCIKEYAYLDMRIRGYLDMQIFAYWSI